MKLTDIDNMEERIALLKETVKPFSERAKENDENATFPFRNFQDLKEIRYPALTIPEEYGGLGISLYEMLRHQEIIGKADGSTALSIGWHMGLMKHLGENHVWKEEKYTEVARDAMNTGALINNIATEPATGSPTRGGRPETVAKKEGNQWVLNGKKTFATLSPILDYFVISASIDDTTQVGNFLVKREREGIEVEETWDSIAMRASGSHAVLLNNVAVDEDDLVAYLTPGKKQAAGWLLHIPACYLGIARAAQEKAVNFARTYSPNSLNGTISEQPNVKQKLGEVELKLMEAQNFLYHIAKKWDESDESIRQTMKTELGAAKLTVVNKAVEAVDLSMRVVGARSLSQQNDLQRYYRDVRAGLHNPPMDDMTIMQLADKSLEEHAK